MLEKTLPIIFALLWSTGFIGARFGLPYIEPFTFLTIRFFIAVFFLFFLILILKIKFPKFQKSYLHVFASGIVTHVGYLSGIFFAIKMGMPPGEVAIIVGMQPILTALICNKRNMLLITFTSVLGFLGLMLVLKTNSSSVVITSKTLLAAVLALLGITFGNIYQKNKCKDFHIITLAFLQYIPVMIIFMLLAYLLERHQIILWNMKLIFAIGWLSLVLSCGTILLMAFLYRKHSSTKAASFFYLAPPLALIQGHIFFNESITFVNIVGMILIVISLYLTNKILIRN